LGDAVRAIPVSGNSEFGAPEQGCFVVEQGNKRPDFDGNGHQVVRHHGRSLPQDCGNFAGADTAPAEFMRTRRGDPGGSALCLPHRGRR
jgi:hypothetical protein